MEHSPHCQIQSTILIVEDSPDIAHLMASILELSNYKVILAQNGLIALEILKTCTPDLITVDLKMPVMDGIEFIKRCRSQVATHIPFIVVSAAEDTRARAADVGVEQSLAKPFDLNEFLALVRCTLKS